MAFPSLNDYKRCIDKNDVKRNAGDDAPEAEYQAPVLYNASTKFVKSKLKKAVDALKSVPDDVPLKKLPDSIRNDVSIEILKAERSILVSFESDEAPAPYQRKNIATLIPNDFCMVSIPQNGFLKLRFSSFLRLFSMSGTAARQRRKTLLGSIILMPNSITSRRLLSRHLSLKMGQSTCLPNSFFSCFVAAFHPRKRPRLTATMSIREPSQTPFVGCSNTVMDGI